MRANTAKSSDKREASTTDDDIAAFMDKTDVSLKKICGDLVNMYVGPGKQDHTYHAIDRLCFLGCNPQVKRSARRGKLTEPKWSRKMSQRLVS